MKPALLDGTVVQKSSRNVLVATGDGTLRCSVRGKFRRPGVQRLPVVVGDRVRVRQVSPGEGVLEERLPRRSELRRSRAADPGETFSRRAEDARERIVAANVDQVLAVFAARVPEPHWGLLDRVLVSAQFEELDAAVCVNKWDQVADEPDQVRELNAVLELYHQIDCPVFRLSALQGKGLDPVRSWLEGKTTVLSGHSGVGKSTLLNAVCPEAKVPTGDVSAATGKGRHVTAAASLYSLESSGFLVDTPGYREYGLGTLEPPDVGVFYPEFRPFLSSCRFTNCLHVSEPDCAVRRAWEEGRIPNLRYENYRQIVDSLR